MRVNNEGGKGIWRRENIVLEGGVWRDYREEERGDETRKEKIRLEERRGEGKRGEERLETIN